MITLAKTKTMRRYGAHAAAELKGGVTGDTDSRGAAHHCKHTVQTGHKEESTREESANRIIECQPKSAARLQSGKEVQSMELAGTTNPVRVEMCVIPVALWRSFCHTA